MHSRKCGDLLDNVESLTFVHTSTELIDSESVMQMRIQCTCMLKSFAISCMHAPLDNVKPIVTIVANRLIMLV